MKHTIEHDLDEAEAKAAVLRAFAHYAERYAAYEPRLRWSDDSHADVGFSVKGLKLSGKIALRPHALDVDLDVPFALRLFKAKAIAVVDREVRHFIELAHRERAERRPGVGQ